MPVINEYGFIEAPYRKVDKENRRVTNEVFYMTADEEDGYIVAEANEPLDEHGNFLSKRVGCRFHEEILEVDAERVDYMDVSPKQLVSVATAMIPFLENDDANRALMGSNMQRQAVPLIRPQAPMSVPVSSTRQQGLRVVVLAKNAGVVERLRPRKSLSARKRKKDQYSF